MEGEQREGVFKEGGTIKFHPFCRPTAKELFYEPKKYFDAFSNVFFFSVYI